MDTLAALTTGAYVLSESYLYTSDAIHDYLDHLTPDGVLSVIDSDFGVPGPGYPRHTMRQLALSVQSLHDRGIDDVAERIAVLASTESFPQVAVLLRNRPFTREEADRLQSFADRMKFNVWALPYRELPTLHSQYLRTAPAARGDFLARQPLTVTPTSDDNPFIVLAIILIGSIVTSALLILMPLAVFQRNGLQTTGKWAFIAFFTAIGLGFIFIEIMLVQKFVLFLGYPTYSLTVVLFSLLTYSGIGSFLTGRMRRAPERRLVPLIAVLATLLLLSSTVLPGLVRAYLGTAFALRVVITSLVLLPLGLVMGMFFPTGIQIVRRANVDFVPWAWGVNGCASVIGTVLAVILAISFGFRVVAMIALAMYVLGVAAMVLVVRMGYGQPASV